MKALSFRQPWAELILQGRKTIDLRTWSTHYRGRLAIHASKQVERDICEMYGLDPATLATGALVGTVEVVDMVAMDDESWETLRNQHLKPGPFPGDLLGWRVTDPRRLPQPIPFRGRLGLFNIADELFEDQSGVSGRPPDLSLLHGSAAGGQLSLFPTSPSPNLSPVPPKTHNRLYHTESTYDPDKPFELRVMPPSGNSSDYGLSLYQWPVMADTQDGEVSDQPRQPQRLINLGGDPLRAVADHILLALRQSGYKATDLSATRRKPFYLDEETGLRLGLLFLTIKPLTRMDRIEAISSALRVMPSEEAYYWFSKCTAAASTANAQRALRILLAGE